MRIKVSIILFVFAAFAVSARAQRMEPPTGAASDSVVYRSAVCFPKNEGEWIPQSQYKAVGRILRWAQANTGVPIVITGWADESGTAAFNEQLSLRRARTVRNYLVKKGIAPERITFEGCGIDTGAESPEKARRAEVRGIIRLALADAPEVRAETESVPVKQEAEAEKIAPPVPEKEITVEEQQQAETTVKKEVQQAEQQTVTAKEKAEAITAQPEQTVKITPETASSSGRYLAVKTNLAAWAGTIMNVAADVQVSEHFSVELPVLWCPWYVSDKHAVKTFTIQPEARYWLSKPGVGHFFGVHAHVGWYSVKWNRDRYQDTDRPLLGAGISYGYLLPFNEHWAGEFTLGAGYANMRYDTYYNIDNGARIDTRTKNYWGITRVGISVVYRFNLKK
ncbi:DUF3575 domain-containing protein [Bacteroides finegoldii]|uniref:DUF3575 domain-containing protein n=1 Tax=Bacteroides finegoldii TaxID=338188 RepID=UPI0032C03A93